MRPPPSWLGVFGPLVLALAPTAASAQAVGSEFQVNSYTTGQQRTSDPPPLTSAGGHLIAADANGGFVVVWTSYGQDGSHNGIFGQRYDRGGELMGAEFQINSYTTLWQHQPAVASNADGDFVVVWASQEQDGSRSGIFGQRFDSAGTPLGGEFRVNSYRTSNQRYPDVASDSAGEFVVVWASLGQEGEPGWGVFGQRYDSQGGRVGNEFHVNTFTTDSQRFPTIASDARGDFVVAWQDDGSPGRDDGIFAQRFDNEGVPQGRRVPRQLLYDGRPGGPIHRQRRHRQLRGGVGQQRSGRKQRRDLRPALRPCRRPARR